MLLPELIDTRGRSRVRFLFKCTVNVLIGGPIRWILFRLRLMFHR